MHRKKKKNNRGEFVMWRSVSHFRHLVGSFSSSLVTTAGRTCSSSPPISGTAAPPPQEDDVLSKLLAKVGNVNTKSRKHNKLAARTSQTAPLSAPAKSTTAPQAAGAASQPQNETKGMTRVQKLLQMQQEGGTTKSPSAPIETHVKSNLESPASLVAALKMSPQLEKEATVPAPAALPPITTSEMIQEGAPQHFTPEPRATNVHRPLLPHGGFVAMADVVGRVKFPPRLLIDEAGNGEYCELFVTYTIPFAETPLAVDIEVRAYGDVLTAYAATCVAQGDLLHVSGHLLPTARSMAVVALPLGGNLSVLVGSRTETR